MGFVDVPDSIGWLQAGVFGVLLVALITSENERRRLYNELEVQLGQSLESPGPVETGWSIEFGTVFHISAFCLVIYLLFLLIGNEIKLAEANRGAGRRSATSTSDNEGSQSVKRIKASLSETREFSIKEFAFYRMDYLLSNRASAKPLSLLLVAYLLMIVGAMVYFVTSHDASLTFSEAVWNSWTFIADPGTHAEQNGFAARVVALVLTIGGMLIFALTIGIIADGVSDLLDDLKKGKSRVIESGHTLILGWSDKALPTIREIAIANESEGGGVIVLLAERPKEDMEADLLHSLSPEGLSGTVVIFRSGSPLIMNDLLKVSAQTAKAVIVLSDPDVEADESDARCVRIVMSLTGIHVLAHIVVEMCDVDNRELVLLVGKGNVETVVAHDIIGRLMIQCARQPGLAQILEQLLGFAGDEFYFAEWPSLTGKTFLDAAFAFDQAIPIGVKPADPEAAENQIKALEMDALSPISSQHTHSPVSPLSRGNSARFFPPSALDDEEEEEEVVHTREETDSQSSDISAQQRRLRHKGRLRSESRSSAASDLPRGVILNPPNGYVIQEGDEILVIAEDDDTYEVATENHGFPSEAAKVARYAVLVQYPVTVGKIPERFMFCGWRRDMDDMISELDKLVCAGSELVLMCTVPVKLRMKRFRDAHKVDLNSLNNLTIIHEEGNPVLRRHLESLRLEKFSSILILADEAFETNMQTADSRSLASLLLIRDIIEKRNQNPTIEAETPNVQTVEDVLSTRDEASDSGDSGYNNSHEGGNTNANDRQRHESFEDSTSDEDEQLTSIITDIRNGKRLTQIDTRNEGKSVGNMEGGPQKLPSVMPFRKSLRPKSDTAPAYESIRREWCPKLHHIEKSTRATIIISEILDSRTKSLISVAQVSDYVMSNEIVACAIAMVAEDRSINSVITEILSAYGSEIQVRSCLEYCLVGEELDFWTVMARARQKSEVAIGYKPSGSSEAVINPRDKGLIRIWQRGDAIVTLSNPLASCAP
uniref:RCK N-terminal domain-containing protein n=1 Tax=Mucochytrium quahogii TaxID=96639 RepID=A0A7S2S8C3_9STRA|mmetsp:Transcript_42220/g.67548  ORF Transcript_42220/g.67548 Transcript_42220/m.67548 type:complete len:996 (+) Transcript_42220:361-3348(+)|eukprot:CAMPEP_0203746812 /NCGR_PEP_ID=MMETSP0098-20131031/2133_1 /ASSEMBLY_ACC=CAM_ASM_000208 /TAXON_ID=96639 /ORGANISM=" , Strain NY0313808BC1" /LENGTH=995 /DNA_ID=CAMNT_0050635049 /DNA_START=295 /DNA_END=3282 /DNA_ORIENTATION=+